MILAKSRLTLLIALLLFSSIAAYAAGTKASFDRDGVLSINGKRIFPIVFTVSPPPDGKTPAGKNAIAELADAGVTMLRAGPLGATWTEARFESEMKMQDAAARYGLYCWLNLRETSGIADGDVETERLLRRIVTTFKDHPGMGLYKGSDEPEWGKVPVESLERAYAVVKELDPDHPIVIIQAPRGTIESLRRYNPVGDVHGFDLYPVGYPPGTHSQFVSTNNEISMVGDYTRRAFEIDSSKPVWMALQIAWSGVIPPGKTLRFPTFPEQRFMTYQAIINGARGLIYFGGHIESTMTLDDRKLGWNWRFWNRVLRPVIEEIGSNSPLYPALLAPDSTLPIKVAGSGIEFCVREVGNEIFVLACKRNHTTEKIQFTGLPEVNEIGELLFEEPRTVQVKDGGFTDWFAPFEVHVYRFKR